MLNLFSKIERSWKTPLFFSLFIIDTIYNFIVSYIISRYDATLIDTHLADKYSLFTIFILTVVIAPIFETFIFQFLLIEILLTFKLKKEIIIYISAILFAATHNYNFVYFIAIIFSGLIYAAYYLYLKSKNKNALFYVILLHSVSNLFIFVIDDVLKL